MDADYISPEETEEEKLRLMNLFEKELKIHGALDLTGFVAERKLIHENHTHSGFVRSIAYKLEATGLYEVIPYDNMKGFLIKNLPQKAWKDRYWWVVLLIGVGIGFFADMGKEALKRKLWPDPDKGQTITPILVNDSITYKNVGDQDTTHINSEADQMDSGPHNMDPGQYPKSQTKLSNRASSYKTLNVTIVGHENAKTIGERTTPLILSIGTAGAVHTAHIYAMNKSEKEISSAINKIFLDLLDENACNFIAGKIQYVAKSKTGKICTLTFCASAVGYNAYKFLNPQKDSIQYQFKMSDLLVDDEKRNPATDEKRKNVGTPVKEPR